MRVLHGRKSRVGDRRHNVHPWGLLVLTTNSDIPQDGISTQDMATHIQHAAAFSSSKFQSWDVASCDHIGFEVIIPSMLECLE